MPSTIVPKALQPNATIAFISPRARLNHVIPAAIERATALFIARGYKIREIYLGPESGIQSSISNRLSEIRTAFTDPSISAIVCTIGGPSFTELLPSLLADTELHSTIRANPKIVVGYSDITGLHWFLHATTGLRTFYGPEPIPELGEPRVANDEAYKTSSLAFCEEHLFRAITDPRPIGDVARSLAYAPEMAAMFKNPSSMETSPVISTPVWKWLRQGKGQVGCLVVA